MDSNESELFRCKWLVCTLMRSKMNPVWLIIQRPQIVKNLHFVNCGAYMEGVERDQISAIRPPKIKYHISDPPKISNIRYHVFAKSQISGLKNQISNITPITWTSYLGIRYITCHKLCRYLRSRGQVLFCWIFLCWRACEEMHIALFVVRDGCKCVGLGMDSDTCAESERNPSRTPNNVICM